jgi:hypothetical protein
MESGRTEYGNELESVVNPVVAKIVKDELVSVRRVPVRRPELESVNPVGMLAE